MNARQNGTHLTDIANRCLKIVTSLRFVYWIALILSSASWALISQSGSADGYELRGGLFSYVLFLILTCGVCIFAVVRVFESRLSHSFKFCLIALQSPGLLFFAWILVQMLPIVLFFGPGICMSTFTSPSGTRSITIEDACFMDCTHTVYRNYFILQKEVGNIYLNSGRICRMKERLILQWNKDETQIEWQVNDRRGTLILE